MERGSTSSSEELTCFYQSGPKNINTNSINWEDDEHRRIIMACLVQSVYVETKELKLKKGQNQARHWYDSFHFKQVEQLKHDSLLYGVVFKFDHSKAQSMGHQNLEKSPSYILAFRGTENIFDMYHDMRLLFERLSQSDRINQAIDKTKSIILKNKEDRYRDKIWLTGHSLGASISTYVGLHIAEQDEYMLKTFLFNPPFSDHTLLERIPKAALTEMLGINHFILSRPIHSIKEGAKECAANALKKFGIMKKMEYEGEEYKNIHKWIPYLFINTRDFICNGFVDHFEKGKNLEDVRPNGIWAFEIKDEKHHIPRIPWKIDKYFPHLLPSGYLVKNTKKIDKNFMSSHKISQWWMINLPLESQVYTKDE
ncbi:hypothetical protein ZOSMA_64G00270 [Zostera marina]|uniref:Fungal lipase-type domain-containing protein n=1 Tax=Zostera marina TaxID=29655 RepID=A0A0K9NUT0_ZOSMR|nr:hypothetical protein ZOSMA_64G00270 [Zostera marina]